MNDLFIFEMGVFLDIWFTQYSNAVVVYEKLYT